MGEGKEIKIASAGRYSQENKILESRHKGQIWIIGLLNLTEGWEMEIEKKIIKR